MSEVHYRTCNLCEAMCGLAIEHAGGKVLSIRGDEADVLSRGYLCPKAVALADLHEDPDRLRAPMRRSGDRWERVDWQSALDECAERLVDVQKRHGRHAVAVYVGNPTAHNMGALLFGLGLFKTLGTFNRYSATSTDQLPHMLAALHMFGHQVLMPVPDLERTDLLLVLGANPVVSNGSIMSAPGMKKRLAAIQKRGGRVIVVDPRRTETAALANEHLFIRPGGDGFLLAALIHEALESGAQPGRLGAQVDGLDEIAKRVRPFTAERVAPVTGIAAERIRSLARELARTPRAAVYGRIGTCTQRYGGLNSWLLYALNIVTGHLDEPGGMMFTRPAADIVKIASVLGEKGHFDRGRSRVRGLPEFSGEYPVATLAEEMETPGEGQIRALITMAGNPVLSAPNGKRIEAALPGLDFMVSLDPYRNETTRHADFILPPTSQLEQGHYDIALHAFAVRNTTKYSPPLFQPGSDSKHDWQIQLELATRIAEKRGGKAAFVARALRMLMLRVGPEGVLDAALRTGPYRLSLNKLRQSPHGIDLGPLAPALPERLGTPDKRIVLVPEVLACDIQRLEAELDQLPSPQDLVLIGRRQLRTNNSWLHNSMAMVKGRDRCTLLMHPKDAEARGLESGQRVLLSSRAGAVEVPLQLTERIMPGVVSLPHGFGHDREGMQLSVASKHAGVSVNDVTDELEVDPLSGTAVLNGVPVRVGPSANAARVDALDASAAE
jgi:anaerobic selenocysteine-containing dehydrogenase